MALRGVKVVELAGLAPAPFCGMVLADFGASVIRIDKIKPSLPNIDCLGNGKRSVSVNLKHKKGVEIFLRLCRDSDVLIEPFRKGVMEKLGLGPDVLQKENKRLIYARLSGFGQKGSYSDRAGHDINFLAVSGLLSMLTWDKSTKPVPPINTIGDFGGGGLMCALGIVMALYEREKSGIGQIVDCSMVEGSAYLASWIYRSQQLPIWGKEKILTGGTSYYDTYETKDGKYVAVGALEPQFYSALLEGLGVNESEMPQFSRSNETDKKRLATIFKQKTRDEWSKVFDGLDACVTPILTIQEALEHEHNVKNGTFIQATDGRCVPRPAPVLSRTPAQSNISKINPTIGEQTEDVLTEIGYSKNDIQTFEDLGAIMTNKL